MNRGKVKLYCEPWGHYATIWLDEIKNMEQNGAYWYIKMKDGNILKDCENAVITYNENEPIEYFLNKLD